MSTTNEYHHLVEIDTQGVPANMTTFTTNCEYLVGATTKDVRVWRVADGKRVATMPMKVCTYCVAVSRDGRWIAGGTEGGDMFICDATTYKQVFAVRNLSGIIRDINFSPDSTHLVSAHSNGTATIWDMTAQPLGLALRIKTLHHTTDQDVYVAKYSLQGDWIATATDECVRVWDSGDGRLIVDVKVNVKGSCSLLWYKSHLFVETRDSTIKEIDAATGLTVSEWLVPDTDEQSCIALPQHGKFIAHSANKTITFWDITTHTQLGLIQHTADIFSFAFSSDDAFLAIVCVGTEIVVKEPLAPEFDIGRAALNGWKLGQLTNAEALLTAAIPTSENRAHLVLASRALVLARLQQWDSALVDAKVSVKIQPSVIGYIAMYVARVGDRETHAGCQVHDIACLLFPSAEHITLLLIKAVVLFMAGEHVDAISRIDDLITHKHDDPAIYVVQAYMYLLLGHKHVESGNYKRAIQLFEDARIKLGNCTSKPPLMVSLVSGWHFDDLVITVQQHLCEALLIAGRTKEAAKCVLRMVDQYINMTEPIKKWISDFKSRCCFKLEGVGDDAVTAKRYDEAISLYTAALSLDPVSLQDLLAKRCNAWAGKGAQKDAMNDAKEWVRLILTPGSWKYALTASTNFILKRSTIYQIICEHLEMIGRVTDAAACFHQMSGELAHENDGEQANWIRDFISVCCSKLENLGDSALSAKQYDEAISQYTVALSLDPSRPQDLLVKRSKAQADKEDWKGALDDANEAINIDASSPSGYERKRATLLGMGQGNGAVATFQAMLSEMSKSSDPVIREQSCHFVRPEQTREAIRTAISNATRDLPEVLISASSGRLCNRSEQAAAFESTPAFMMLIASMTTHIDHALIEQVAGEFYRYVTFSHTWEGSEPLYEKVTKIVVYDLEASPTHKKLQMFCKVVRDEGFNWAWSDTCCIDKGDHFVYQRSLVSMFAWYEGSAMTIIYLYDVDKLAVLGALTRSRWNSRGWTLQEYHASKVVRIYTKDWTPYLGLTIHNHKESPEIISEMEQATGISAQALTALRPGLNDIREKLRLASTRQTTHVEDAAYSLLGIFSMSLPVTYGEGDRALGRLLSQLLMSSGDTTILAWSGGSGSFNSCLPTNIIVFSQPLTRHIPPALTDAEMDEIVRALHTSSLDGNLVRTLYDRVDELRIPTFSGQRMRLPCLIFKIRLLSRRRDGPEFTFRARAGVLGAVEIKTKQCFTPEDSLCLVHPWLDFLLDRRATRRRVEVVPRENETLELDEFVAFDILSSTSHTDSDTASLPSPTQVLTGAQRRAYEFLARLRQPFGALLLAANPRNVAEYSRVATECLITVQVEEITSATLNKLIQSVRELDVL